jgi:hypothetical protein
MRELSQTPPTFSADEAQAIIRELRQTPDAFARLLASEREEILHHRPDGGWSAVEVVGHLAHHDAFERTQRFEAILASERPALPGDNTRFHVAEANYQARSAEEALAFFRRERALVVAFLERLPPRDWMRTGIHPHDGERTLLQLADLRGHDREHLEQARDAIADATAKP